MEKKKAQREKETCPRSHTRKQPSGLELRQVWLTAQVFALSQSSPGSPDQQHWAPGLPDPPLFPSLYTQTLTGFLKLTGHSLSPLASTLAPARALVSASTTGCWLSGHIQLRSERAVSYAGPSPWLTPLSLHPNRAWHRTAKEWGGENREGSLDDRHEGGWADGWGEDGQTDGWVDRRMDGWVGGWMQMSGLEL